MKIIIKGDTLMTLDLQYKYWLYFQISCPSFRENKNQNDILTIFKYNLIFKDYSWDTLVSYYRK